LDVFDSASPVAHPRVGVIVPKHRRNSVERNKLKRRLREVLRLEVLPRLISNEAAVDLLVRARREAYAATYDQLHDELAEFVERKWSRARSSL
jgi:ribonuclease P protein component